MAETEEKKRVLSPALIGFLRRRLMELTGLVLLLAGLVLTATLFSPGRYDPSFSAFSSGAIDNWFGAPGAAIAGALRASLGTAGFFATLLPVGWGYRLLRKQGIGNRVARLFLAPVALLCLAGGLYGLSGGDGSAAGGAHPSGARAAARRCIRAIRATGWRSSSRVAPPRWRRASRRSRRARCRARGP